MEWTWHGSIFPTETMRSTKKISPAPSVAEETGIPVAALLDTKGPEIRTGILKDGNKITLKEGQEFTLTTEEVVGDETMVHINYDGPERRCEGGRPDPH